MSEEKQQTEAIEEKAPELPTSEPPKEEVKPEETKSEEPKTTEETAPAAPAETENAETEENKDDKKPSRLKKRLTLKWGKNRDQAEAPKEPEPPMDPRENALGWIGQQIPAAVHKVNYHVLEWIQKLTVEDESARVPLPGKDGQVTRNQFLAFLRDGDVLTKVANKMQAGAVEPVVEEGTDATKQKEAQTKNVEAFATWAKETLGMDESKAMTAADLLEKGKAGYPAVFETLWNLGLKAQEKFEQTGLDVEAVTAAAGAAVRTNLIGQILSFFRRSRRTPEEKKEEDDKPAEEAVAEAPNAPEGEQVEESCQKVDAAQPPVVAVS